MSKRKRRPEHESEDLFVATVLRLWAWAQQNTRALLLGAIAVGVLVAGVLYYMDYQQRIREAASTELRQIRFQLESGNLSETVEEIRNFNARFGDTEYGIEGRVLLAHALLLQNRPTEAIGPARAAASRLGKDPVATRAAFLLAAAYEEVGDTTSAMTVYEDIGNRGRLDADRIRGLESAAILRAARGDSALAAALYERVAALLPEEDPEKGFYEQRAAELRADPLSQASTDAAS